MHSEAYKEVVLQGRKLLEKMYNLHKWDEEMKEIDTWLKYCTLIAALREFNDVNKEII